MHLLCSGQHQYLKSRIADIIAIYTQAYTYWWNTNIFIFYIILPLNWPNIGPYICLSLECISSVIVQLQYRSEKLRYVSGFIFHVCSVVVLHHTLRFAESFSFFRSWNNNLPCWWIGCLVKLVLTLHHHFSWRHPMLWELLLIGKWMI